MFPHPADVIKHMDLIKIDYINKKMNLQILKSNKKLSKLV